MNSITRRALGPAAWKTRFFITKNSLDASRRSVRETYKTQPYESSNTDTRSSQFFGSRNQYSVWLQ